MRMRLQTELINCLLEIVYVTFFLKFSNQNLTVRVMTFSSLGLSKIFRHQEAVILAITLSIFGFFSVFLEGFFNALDLLS